MLHERQSGLEAQSGTKLVDQQGRVQRKRQRYQRGESARSGEATMTVSQISGCVRLPTQGCQDQFAYGNVDGVDPRRIDAVIVLTRL